MDFGSGLSIEVENALWNELGGSCWPVYTAIMRADYLLNSQEITEVIDKSERTIKRALVKLTKIGLINKHNADQWSPSVKTLNVLAEELDIHNQVEDRRATIKIERLNYVPIRRRIESKLSPIEDLI